MGGMESWSEHPSSELFLNVSKCLAQLQKGNASCVLTMKWIGETVEAAAGGTPFVGDLHTSEK